MLVTMMASRGNSLFEIDLQKTNGFTSVPDTRQL